jgi:hypothetical protein
MMREKILAVLLIISLSANVYLVFFEQSSDQGFQQLVNIHMHPGENITNSSNNSELNRTVAVSLPTPTNVTTVPTQTPTPKPTPSPTPPPWISYSNSKYRFSLEYPREWDFVDKSKSSASPAIIITTPPELECSSETTECYKLLSTFTVDVIQNPETIVLEDYFNDAVSTLQQEYYITTTSKSAPTTLSDNKAYRIDFFTRDERGNPDKSYLQYYTIIDKKVYILTYSGPYSTQETVFDYYKRDAQEIIKSFEVDREYKTV